MQELFFLLRQAAPSNANILITGESGTGKEVVARLIHELSPRSAGPFVAMNCAALPESLIESELCRHEKGSFTGALTARQGCLELPTPAPSCWTKSAPCRLPCKPSCCAFWRTAGCVA